MAGEPYQWLRSIPPSSYNPHPNYVISQDPEIMKKTGEELRKALENYTPNHIFIAPDPPITYKRITVKDRFGLKRLYQKVH